MMDQEFRINQNNNYYIKKHIPGWINWKHKDIRYLPLGLKQSETSHGSTNFHFAESGKELQSTFLSPTRSGYSSGWELEFLT